MFGKKRKEKEKEEHPVVGEFLKIQDVDGFFKYNINPSYIEAKVQTAVQRELEGRRQIPYQLFAVLGILLVFGAIAYVIVSGQMGESQCQATLRELAKNRERVVTPQTTPATKPSQPSGSWAPKPITISSGG